MTARTRVLHSWEPRGVVQTCCTYHSGAPFARLQAINSWHADSTAEGILFEKPLGTKEHKVEKRLRPKLRQTVR